MMEIALAFHDGDGHYAMHAAAVLISVFKNTQRDLRAHIVHDSSLTQAAKNGLNKVAAFYGRSIHFYEVQPPEAKIAALMPPQLGIGSLYRLHLPRLLDASQVLYLDCDICCNMDIGELWDYPLSDADQTPLLSWSLNRNHEYKKNLPPHYNTGVMLLHLNQIRKVFPDLHRATARAIPFVKGLLNFPDQDALNRLLEKLPTRQLPEKFNFQLHVDKRWLYPAEKLNNRILHYCGRKPWCAPAFPSAEPHLENYRILETILSGGATDSDKE